MDNLKITLIQANQTWEDKTANLEHFETLLEGIGETDLILLPEMFHTGFSMNGAALAETTDDSMALEWIRRMAAEKQAAVYTSFIARDGAKLYNRGVFAQADGSVIFYDKRKTFGMAGENAVYASGQGERIVDYKGWKINLQICYDLRFPENVRNGIAEDGKPLYDLLLYVANWPARRIAHWNALLPARAIENQCVVAAVNRVGTDANGLDYSGDSAVYDALGDRKLSFEKGVESVQTVEISRDALMEAREKLPFLIDSDYRLFNR
jgi:omega-amidase